MRKERGGFGGEREKLYLAEVNPENPNEMKLPENLTKIITNSQHIIIDGSIRDVYEKMECAKKEAQFVKFYKVAKGDNCAFLKKYYNRKSPKNYYRILIYINPKSIESIAEHYINPES